MFSNREPLVSILIPVFNVEKYLNKCLDTVIQQTYSRVEIIIIDDGSTDNSLQIIKEYAQNDRRIKYITRENRGLINTRVEAMELSTGDYIAYVDSDDWIELNYIEKLVYTAIKFKAEIVRCGDIIEYLEEKRRRNYCLSDKVIKIVEKENYGKELIPKLLNSYFYNSVHSELIERKVVCSDAIDRIKNKCFISIGDDVVINCELFKYTNRILTIPDCLYHYRKNNTSIMHTEMSFDKYEKRLNDTYYTMYSIRELAEFLGEGNEKEWEKSCVKQIDVCVKEYMKKQTANEEKVKAICLANLFIREKKIACVNGKKYKYLFEMKQSEYTYFSMIIMGNVLEAAKKGVKKIYSYVFCR